MRRARAAGIATIGVSHGTVSGCVTEHGVPMAGLDHEFTTTALFGAEASAFLLGHIHKHQWWREGDRLVAYRGFDRTAPLRRRGRQGIHSLDRRRRVGASLEFVATPARRMVHLDFGGPPDLAAIQTAAASAQGAFVRVRWNIAEEERESVDRAAIVAALVGAAEVKLEARVIPVLRSRAEGISGAHSLNRSCVRWAEATGVEVEGLAARLGELESSEVEEIVRRVSNDDRDLRRGGISAFAAARSARRSDRRAGDRSRHGAGRAGGALMIPETLHLKGFAGIRAGLGRDELSLDLVQLAGDAELVAFAGPNGTGKTTVMDNLQPYRLLPSRASSFGPGRILVLRAPGATGVRQGTRLAACGSAVPLHAGLSHERQTQDRGVSARRGEAASGFR